jgi:hypothetical protein
VEIIHNLTDRITEARMNGWLGEVQGLQVSLTKAKNAGARASHARTQQAVRAPGGSPEARTCPLLLRNSNEYPKLGTRHSGF